MTVRYAALTLLVCLFMAPGCSSGPATQEDVRGVDTLDAVGDTAGSVSDTLDSVGDAPVDRVEPDAVPDTAATPCNTCQNDDDCRGDQTCATFDTGKACTCVDDGDCRNGFMCYDFGLSGIKACLPTTFNCPACVVDEGCQDETCCDVELGTCRDCATGCANCLHDYECVEGYRCYSAVSGTPGLCVPECVDGGCGIDVVGAGAASTVFTCVDRGAGVSVCAPDEDYCPNCPEITPYSRDGECVECLDNRDCDNDGGPGVCLPSGMCASCQGLCGGGFPVCAIVDGEEQCVQCVKDEDCARFDESCVCVGEPLYTCMDGQGAICDHGGDGCTAPCEEQGDCAPLYDGAVMDCVAVPGQETRTCVESGGRCDNVNVCCAPGAQCYDLAAIAEELVGPPVVLRLIEQPDELLMFCGCTVAEDCLAGQPCTEMAVLCDGTQAKLGNLYEILCPEGQLDSRIPPKLCVESLWLQDTFGIPPAN